MIDKYTENNPLSQLSFLLLRNRNVITLNDFAEPPEKTKTKLFSILKEHRNSEEFSLHNTLQMKTIGQNEPFGQISLLKGLQKAKSLFAGSPLYFHKEVYAVIGSSNTNDTEDIYSALDFFSRESIRVSIVSLNCSCYLFERIVELCNGRLAVPSNKETYEDYIFDIAEPLFAQTTNTVNCDFNVCFPHLKILKNPQLCMCHRKLM